MNVSIRGDECAYLAPDTPNTHDNTVKRTKQALNEPSAHWKHAKPVEKQPAVSRNVTHNRSNVQHPLYVNSSFEFSRHSQHAAPCFSEDLQTTICCLSGKREELRSRVPNKREKFTILMMMEKWAWLAFDSFGVRLSQFQKVSRNIWKLCAFFQTKFRKHTA